MKITDALLGEHGLLYALLDHVERDAPGWNLDQAHTDGAALAAALKPHAAVEDDLLFPALEPWLGRETGPLAVMRREHAEIETALERWQAAPRLEDCQAHARRLVALARDHFAKEEGILFPLAERRLGEARLEELGGRWASERHVRMGM